MAYKNLESLSRERHMDGDLVTIVIPAYNAEQFLCENVEAVLNQTYKNMEIIYICDGCTDHTVESIKI